jgi:hypothetical protein
MRGSYEEGSGGSIGPPSSIPHAASTRSFRFGRAPACLPTAGSSGDCGTASEAREQLQSRASEAGNPQIGELPNSPEIASPTDSHSGGRLQTHQRAGSTSTDAPSRGFAGLCRCQMETYD